MNGSGRSGMMAAVMVALLVAPAAWAAGTIVLPRPGQVGLGLAGGYGMLFKSGKLGGDFGEGPTLAARLRYRMRYERALGLTFENQRHEIRVAEPTVPGPTPGSTLPGRDHINVVLSGLEFYQMFGTRTRTVKMLMVGAGVAQTSGRFIDQETFYPGDGAFVSAGVGVERFLFHSWALDLSTRYMTLFLPDDRAHDVQAAVGLMFYASY
jgi:hypothetical protein